MEKFEYNEEKHKQRLTKYIKRFEHANNHHYDVKTTNPTKFFLFWEDLYFSMINRYYRKEKLEPLSDILTHSTTQKFIEDTFEEKYKERIDYEVLSLQQDIIDLESENEMLKKIIEGFGKT